LPPLVIEILEREHALAKSAQIDREEPNQRGGEEVDPEGKGSRGPAPLRGPPSLFSPGGRVAAGRATRPKKGVLPRESAAGTADRGKIPATAGTAFFMEGYFGAAVITKKTGTPLHGGRA
jgi:hypothetical protein